MILYDRDEWKWRDWEDGETGIEWDTHSLSKSGVAAFGSTGPVGFPFRSEKVILGFGFGFEFDSKMKVRK
jgi:hypothetical protein